MRALHAVALAVAGCAPPAESSVTSALECGPGTMLDGNECVAPAVSCGPGTVEEDGACVPDDVRFLLRARRKIFADGVTPIQVRAFGREADGTPSHEQVVFNTDRPASGSFSPPTLQLDDRGALTSFVPCNLQTPGCLGPLQLTVALASAPTTPVATLEVELVSEPSIGSIEHCLTGGDVLHIEGNGFLYRGSLTILAGTFVRSGGTQRAALTVTPDDPAQGSPWSLEFSSVPLGAPLVPGIYRDAGQFSTSGTPRMNVTNTSPYAHCLESYRGEFQVHELTFTSSLERLAVSFRQWCSLPTRIIEGCVYLD